ncbi:MAG: sigma-70 family RNA polymerase sigma factor [Clostridia bacterium]|nr:sigma-70 family RNA polymerase sigma factor [Clostridia bacterium]
MDDKQIVALYWARNELAITESQRKYAAYCHSIAKNILGSEPDAEEATNDTWLSAWHAIPPHKPMVLSTFLGKLTRRIAIDKWRRNHSEKRGGGQTALVLEELAECLPASSRPEEEVEQAELAACIREFIQTLPTTEQRVFLCRYWYLDSLASIARRFGFSEGKVKSMLFRTRRKLQQHLSKEGF